MDILLRFAPYSPGIFIDLQESQHRLIEWQVLLSAEDGWPIFPESEEFKKQVIKTKKLPKQWHKFSDGQKTMKRHKFNDGQKTMKSHNR